MNNKTAMLRRSVMQVILLLSVSIFAFSQTNFPVTGKITDASGQPIEGVTVQERGTNNITLTKKDGTFSLQASSGKAVIDLSYVGYETQQIAVNNQSDIAVSLRASANSLNEVVVVGYGTQKKSDVTGALSR